MLKRIFLGLLAGFLLLGEAPTIRAKSAAAQRNAQANFVPHELLVKFKSGTPAYVRGEIHRGAAAAVVGRFSSDARLEHVRLPAGENLDSAIAYYSTRADVQYVQKNFIYRPLEILPNDTLFQGQWALKNQIVNGNAMASVNATYAWTKTKGRFNVVVAVLDTGVDYTHPDLGLNVWTNPAEAGLNCSDGLDNDADGYVDDCRGWDFFNNTNNPMDVTGHGTQMAGVIGALTNNARGVAGANWDIQIMPLRVSDDLGNIYSSVAAQALDYSYAHGATIANASWGGTGFDQDHALLDAINRAGAAGELFVTAAGNQSSDNDTTPFYPCSYSQSAATNVVCVTSTDENDGLATSSNRGALTVQLGAPGVEIPTTGSTQPPFIDPYVTGNGTSFAAAYVTGGAALLKGCKASLDSATIKDILLDHVRQVSALQNGVTTTGGVVDYQAALDDSRVPTCDSTATTSTPVANAGGSYNVNLKNQPVQFSGTHSSDTGGQLLLYFWDFGDGSFGAGVKPTHSYTAKGTYTAKLFVRDNQGVIASDTATVNIRPNNIR